MTHCTFDPKHLPRAYNVLLSGEFKDAKEHCDIPGRVAGQRKDRCRWKMVL
jgi:hypothetical protein